MPVKKVALFGGAFDPPHLGHQKVAEVVNTEYIDEVWFVPVFKHPWAHRYGKDTLAPYTDRVTMLESIVGENQKIEHYREISFVYPTLQYFEAEHPDIEFSWIMGSEYISRFADFLAGHPQLAEYTFYIYPRTGFPLHNLYPNMVGLYDMEEISISSTQVRQAVASGHSLEGLVTPFVAKYIAASQLYLPE